MPRNNWPTLLRNGWPTLVRIIHPNCGLSCYLGEAYILSKPNSKGFDNLVDGLYQLLFDEKEKFNNDKKCSFWGWEKNPTIGSKFPLDWDDTAKAIDFIKAADNYKKIAVDVDEILPKSKTLNQIFKNSIFENKNIGIDKNNANISCPYKKALFVFFGQGSEKYNSNLRDDPMVTVTTLRMLAMHYPEIINENRQIVKSLLLRLLFTLDYLLKNNLYFKDISRYYFSLGHFAFRLIECVELLSSIGFLFNKSKFTSNKNIKSKIEESYSLINDSSTIHDDGYIENFWWYLIGLKIELITIQSDFHAKAVDLYNLPDRVIYQHRGLGHQYFSPGWENKLILFEIDKHNDSISKNNEKNFSGLRYLKKTSLPIFALISFIIYNAGYWLNQDKILENLKLKEILFHDFAEVETVFSVVIFMFIGLKLYLHAWAIEETYFTNRIIAPIKNDRQRKYICNTELIFRFVWTTLIMFFPIYFSEESQMIKIPFLSYINVTWYLYIAIIFALILLWNIPVYIGFSELYSVRKIKIPQKITLYWFKFDIYIAIASVVLASFINLNFQKQIESWGDIIFFFLILIISILSAFQILFFSKLIFSNRITYKYDS